MKILVVYYSRTGRTRKIAEEIAQKTSADTEEIIDTQQRSGVIGFIHAGRQAKKEALTNIKTTTKNPCEYDIIIIGTPIWYYTMTTPIRTYLNQQKENLHQVAFICTYGGIGLERAFVDMEALCGKRPLATLGISTPQLIRGTYRESLNLFCSKLTIP